MLDSITMYGEFVDTFEDHTIRIISTRDAIYFRASDVGHAMNVDAELLKHSRNEHLWYMPDTEIDVRGIVLKTIDGRTAVGHERLLLTEVGVCNILFRRRIAKTDLFIHFMQTVARKIRQAELADYAKLIELRNHFMQIEADHAELLEMRQRVEQFNDELMSEEFYTIPIDDCINQWVP